MTSCQNCLTPHSAPCVGRHTQLIQGDHRLDGPTRLSCSHLVISKRCVPHERAEQLVIGYKEDCGCSITASDALPIALELDVFRASTQL